MTISGAGIEPVIFQIGNAVEGHRGCTRGDHGRDDKQERAEAGQAPGPR